MSWHPQVELDESKERIELLQADIKMVGFPCVLWDAQYFIHLPLLVIDYIRHIVRHCGLHQMAYWAHSSWYEKCSLV